MEPSFFVVVLGAHAHQLGALSVIEAGNPGSPRPELVSQVKIVRLRA